MQAFGHVHAPLASLGVQWERIPFPGRIDPEILPQLIELWSRQQLRMVHRIAGKGEPIALHRVGKDDDRRVLHLVGFIQHLDQTRQVVPTKIPDQGLQFIIGNVRHRIQNAVPPVAVSHTSQAPPEFFPIGDANQRLVFLVRHGVDPRPQCLTVRTAHRRFERCTVLGFEYGPASPGEQPLQPGRLDPRNHPVETLPVEVDDPDDVAEALDGFFSHRLPDITFIELGIAHQ